MNIEYIAAATDQLHNIEQTFLLHLSLPFQATNLIQEILTLSLQDFTAILMFFSSKRIQSRVGSFLYKFNRLSQVLEQGGIM